MLDLETPVCVARAEVIDCPEYPSDPSLKVSDFFENPTCFKNAKIANPFHSALGSDFFFELGSKEIRSTERPQAALKIQIRPDPQKFSALRGPKIRIFSSVQRHRREIFGIWML